MSYLRPRLGHTLGHWSALRVHAAEWMAIPAACDRAGARAQRREWCGNSSTVRGNISACPDRTFPGIGSLPPVGVLWGHRRAIGIGPPAAFRTVVRTFLGATTRQSERAPQTGRKAVGSLRVGNGGTSQVAVARSANRHVLGILSCLRCEQIHPHRLARVRGVLAGPAAIATAGMAAARPSQSSIVRMWIISRHGNPNSLVCSILSNSRSDSGARAHSRLTNLQASRHTARTRMAKF
jgi:hypothetical protein